MPSWIIWAVLGGGFMFFLLIHLISKSKKPIKNAVLSILTGILAMLCVNLTTVFTGVFLPVSTLTVSASIIGGLPCVTLMLLLNIFI